MRIGGSALEHCSRMWNDPYGRCMEEDWGWQSWQSWQSWHHGSHQRNYVVSLLGRCTRRKPLGPRHSGTVFMSCRFTVLYTEQTQPAGFKSERGIIIWGKNEKTQNLLQKHPNWGQQICLYLYAVQSLPLASFKPESCWSCTRFVILLEAYL